MKRALLSISAALMSTAAAQEIATSLPLTSVGQKLMWTVGDQDLKLVVGVGSKVQLDVYGAQFDPEDYRSKKFFGDENYSTERPKAPVSSTFTLLDASGKVLKQRDFGAGAQDWQTFLNDDLAAGSYTLRVSTQGNGKNTFALRLNSVSAAVQANHLNVTVHSKEWIPALNVTNPGGAMTVRMYDGDGPTELEAELRDAAGKAYPIKVSGQLQWQDIKVPEGQGNYTLYLRQPSGAYQFSNSVGFELGQGPITVVKTDTTGRLEIKAELILPDEVLPTQADVTVGERHYSVNGSVGPYTLPAKDYPVSVVPIKGAVVTVDKEQVTVVKEQTAQVKVQVRPDVALSFAADKPEVCVGDVVQFTAEATTEFERQTLPASLQIALPKGFTSNGQTSATAKVDAKNPGRLTFEAKAELPGTGSFTATLAPWNKKQALDVKVLASATQLELRREPLAQVLPGDTVTVSLSLRNISRAPAPYTLTDNPGAALEALESTSFKGELAAGESKTFSYKAKVRGQPGEQAELKAQLSSSCEATQASTGSLTVGTPETPVVVTQRESVVHIPFDAPRSMTQLIVAHQPPVESKYVPGSSALNGKTIDDPQVGPSGKYYWTLPGQQRGELTYKLSHEGALPELNGPILIGKYAKGTYDVLVGDDKLDDLKDLKPLGVEAAEENPGAIKQPLAGTVYRERDRITVVVEGAAQDDSLPTLNGTPISAEAMGKKVVDAASGTQRREFFGLALKPGENIVSYGGQDLKVYLAGRAVDAQLSGEQLVADGVTPVRVKVKVVDASGLTTGGSVTVKTVLEPTQPDAKPLVGSYQIKLIDGVGTLELEPMSAPTRFDVRVLVGEKVVVRSFETVPSQTRVAIGMVSAGALLSGKSGGGFTWAGEARGNAYSETPMGGGKLYVSAAGAVTAEPDENGKIKFAQDRQQGLPTTANPLERYPHYGDSSKHEIPLQGIDPVAFRYEHPAFNLQYRQSALPVDVFDTGVNPTALSGFTRSNPQVAGFVAMLPSERVQVVFEAPGTRILPLNSKGSILADSEVVELVTVDKFTGAISYTALQRLVNYTVDNGSGVIYFQRPVDFYDKDGNKQRVRVTYRLDDPNVQRKLAWGVQASSRLLNDHLTVGAAAVSLDQVSSFGARARYDDGVSKADLLAAYSGTGTLLRGTAGLKAKRLNANLGVKYQSAGYTGLNAVAEGLAVESDVTYKVTDRLGVTVAGQYKQLPATPKTGTVDLKAQYEFSPFTVGAGVRLGFADSVGTSALGSVGYNKDGLSAKLEQVLSLNGTQKSSTVFTAAVPLRENVSLTARDEFTWGVGHKASLGLLSKLGMTNLAVSYDLPGADGWGNRARFGAETTLPVSDKLGVDFSGSYLWDLKGQDTAWNVGAGAKYKDQRLTATLASDLAKDNAGFRVAVRGGAAYSVDDRLTFSVEGNRIFSAVSTLVGSNYAASVALRASQWQSLAYIRYKDGALAAQKPEVIGEVNVEYHVPRYALRAGLAGRSLLNQAGSFTYQASGSGTYYLTDRLGLGLAARALVQPATGYTGLSFGLEGSVRALPGTWLTLGYNPVGFTGIGSNLYTRQGVYVRMDMMFDDAQSNGVQGNGVQGDVPLERKTSPGGTAASSGSTDATPSNSSTSSPSTEGTKP